MNERVLRTWPDNILGSLKTKYQILSHIQVPKPSKGLSYMVIQQLFELFAKYFKVVWLFQMIRFWGRLDDSCIHYLHSIIYELYAFNWGIKEPWEFALPMKLLVFLTNINFFVSVYLNNLRLFHLRFTNLYISKIRALKSGNLLPTEYRDTLRYEDDLIISKFWPKTRGFLKTDYSKKELSFSS